MSGTTSLVLLGILLVLGYWAACVWWPFTKCPHPKCDGGKHRSPTRKAWRSCWWCRGKGSRVRLGRRLFEAMTGRRKHTTRRGG